jgi:DNA-binding NarL/FixJ family response regulator
VDVPSRGGDCSHVNGSPVLRVAVISRYPLVRLGLTHMIEATSSATVVDLARHDGGLTHLDAAVYDLAALAVERSGDELGHLVGTVPVVGLARDGRGDLTEGARAVGVRTFVAESATGAELLDALGEASGSGPRRIGPHRDLQVLTGRERTILALIGSGYTNDQIARELFLSINSVKTYIRAAYRKIGVKTRSEAVLWAVRAGQTSGHLEAAER